MNTRTVKIIAVMLAFLNLSCTASLNPKDFEIKTISVPSLQNIKPLSIKAKLTGAKEKVLPVPGGTIIVNEDEFTEVLVERLSDTLKSNNISILPASERNIEIQVVKVAIQPDRTLYCVIDFNRKAGDGEYYGFQSRSKSWNYETACEEALNNAVTDLLADPFTLRYLRGE